MYTQITLSEFVAQIGVLMDDTTAVYWTVPEIQSVIYEAMRVWGATTNYWRTRGVFNLSPTQNSAYYDLSVVLPSLRTRTWTIGQMVTDIQYMLLENPSGVAGTGMSGQVGISSILNAIQVARNRFVLDTRFPLSIHSILEAPPPPTGLIDFPQDSVYVHRAAWQDITSGTWANLWRSDAWGYDKSDPMWNSTPGAPELFSEAENAPLKLQLVPPPVANGYLEALTVDSLSVDVTSDASLFNIPDEWIHAVKYSALSYLLSGEGQIKDMVRATYAEQRYQQAVALCVDARSIIRLLSNGVPLNIDSLVNIDSSQPFWRNQTGTPESAGVLYDIVAINPGSPDAQYGIAADVVQTAPLPTLGVPTPEDQSQYMQIGPEELDHISDYVCHVLTFKCGGAEFKSTMSGYDNFMQAVAGRKAINAAKIRYMVPLFGMPQKEWASRPDKMEATNA